MTPAPDAALARLEHQPFFEPGWLYERKLDGVRCLAERSGGRTRLWTRTGRDVAPGFPELVDAFDGQRSDDFVVDGEIVAFDGPVTSFARLQARIHVSDPVRARRTGVAVHLYLFDVLRAEGEDVRRRDLLARKRVLRGLLVYDDPLRLTPYRRAADADFFAGVCRRGWRG